VKHPVTPDGRYFVVCGRLWRMANRGLVTFNGGEAGRTRRQKAADREAEAVAHRIVDEVKRALGERGPAWWDDGSPDFNRHMAKNTPYANWYAGLSRADQRGTLK
jgi:hypothetical protein